MPKYNYTSTDEMDLPAEKIAQLLGFLGKKPNLTQIEREALEALEAYDDMRMAIKNTLRAEDLFWYPERFQKYLKRLNDSTAVFEKLRPSLTAWLKTVIA